MCCLLLLTLCCFVGKYRSEAGCDERSRAHVDDRFVNHHQHIQRIGVQRAADLLEDGPQRHMQLDAHVRRVRLQEERDREHGGLLSEPRTHCLVGLLAEWMQLDLRQTRNPVFLANGVQAVVRRLYDCFCNMFYCIKCYSLSEIWLAVNLYVCFIIYMAFPRKLLKKLLYYYQ